MGKSKEPSAGEGVEETASKFVSGVGSNRRKHQHHETEKGEAS